MGPANEATPWKPWLKFSRAAAYLGLPRIEMYEFAATSRQERPQPNDSISVSPAERVFGPLSHR